MREGRADAAGHLLCRFSVCRKVMDIIRIPLVVAGILSFGFYAGAQLRLGEGQVSASLESNSVYYVDDKTIGDGPEDRFGTNNYLKVDYSLGRFSAGIQLEGYMPALYGYELGEQPDVRKFFLAGKYVQWTDDSFEVRAGDIYDQFGNGLVFRSYEDRQLGLNNSLEGIRGIYRLSNYLTVKGLYGRPRLYTNYAGSWIRGADLSVSVADIFGWNAVFLNVEGSYVNRYEALDKDESIDFNSYYRLDTPSLNMASGRINFNWNTLSLSGEYAWKSKDIMIGTTSVATEGSAVYAEALYSWKTLSVSATYRMLDNMGTNLTLYGSGTGNMMNYLPSLTRQYTYMLANLNPYQVNTVGEQAGQVARAVNLKAALSEAEHAVLVRVGAREQARAARRARGRHAERMLEQQCLLAELLDARGFYGIAIRADNSARVMGVQVENVHASSFRRAYAAPSGSPS